jgi:hypothetical protein
LGIIDGLIMASVLRLHLILSFIWIAVINLPILTNFWLIFHPLILFVLSLFQDLLWDLRLNSFIRVTISCGLLLLNALFAFGKEIIDFVFFFQLHFGDAFAYVVPMGALARVDEFGEVAFGHAEALFSQKVQKIDDVIRSALLQNEPFDFALFFACLSTRLQSVVRIPPQSHFLQLGAEALPLFVEEVYDLWLHQTLSAALRRRLSH